MPNYPWQPRSGFFLGVAEQFTSFDTIQVDGREIPNRAHQYLDSSITQVFLGYNFTRALGLQLTVPLIDRSFRRTAGDRIETGRESGVGDISLLAHFSPVLIERGPLTFHWKLSGGVKLPTGSSDRLHEEELEGAEGESTLPASGTHGHDLALGSGSVDGIVGTGILARHGRMFLTADAQYAIRGRGDHSYRYANDFSWSAGPGFYLKQDSDITFAVQLMCSGESKGKDTFRGAKAEDTAATAVYLGPKFIGTWKDKLAADVGLDIPVVLHNSALQSVPDYRVRAGVSWAF